MPLVVPGINSGDVKTQGMDWQLKLMGKKIGDKTDELTFAKSDLPPKTRILKPGDMATMDHNPERMNIHLGEDGTVREITHK